MFEMFFAALNEVSAANVVEWMQGGAILGVVAVTSITTWVVYDLWRRVEWLDDTSASWSDIQDLRARVGAVEDAVSKHDKMLAHMESMRAAKAAKRAAKVAKAA